MGGWERTASILVGKQLPCSRQDACVFQINGETYRSRRHLLNPNALGATAGLSGSARFPRRHTAGQANSGTHVTLPTLCVGRGRPPPCGDSGARSVRGWRSTRSQEREDARLQQPGGRGWTETAKEALNSAAKNLHGASLVPRSSPGHSRHRRRSPRQTVGSRLLATGAKHKRQVPGSASVGVCVPCRLLLPRDAVCKQTPLPRGKGVDVFACVDAVIGASCWNDNEAETTDC